MESDRSTPSSCRTLPRAAAPLRAVRRRAAPGPHHRSAGPSQSVAGLLREQERTRRASFRRSARPSRARASRRSPRPSQRPTRRSTWSPARGSTPLQTRAWRPAERKRAVTHSRHRSATFVHEHEQERDNTHLQGKKPHQQKREACRSGGRAATLRHSPRYVRPSAPRITPSPCRRSSNLRPKRRPRPRHPRPPALASPFNPHGISFSPQTLGRRYSSLTTIFREEYRCLSQGGGPQRRSL